MFKFTLIAVFTLVSSENLEKRAHKVSHVDTEVSFRMALLNESYLKLILPGRDAVKKSICDKIKDIASNFPSATEKPFGVESCEVEILEYSASEFKNFEKGDIKVKVMFLGKYNSEGLQYVMHGMKHIVKDLPGGRYLYELSGMLFTELEAYKIFVYVNTHEVPRDRRTMSDIERQIARILLGTDNNMTGNEERNTRQQLSEISTLDVNRRNQRRNNFYLNLKR